MPLRSGRKRHPSLEAAEAAVAAASAMTDVLCLVPDTTFTISKLPSCSSPSVAGAGKRRVEFVYRSTEQLSSVQRAECLALVRDNMSAYSSDVTGGWSYDAKEKEKEIDEKEARFLLAFERPGNGSDDGCEEIGAGGEEVVAGGKVQQKTKKKKKKKTLADGEAETEGKEAVEEEKEEEQEKERGGQTRDKEEEGKQSSMLGFAHIRFDVELGQPVVYLYELQIRASQQGSGLGSALMRLVERVAAATAMRRVMLTVFLANERALSFYTRRLGYQPDETDPIRCALERELCGSGDDGEEEDEDGDEEDGDDDGGGDDDDDDDEQGEGVESDSDDSDDHLDAPVSYRILSKRVVAADEQAAHVSALPASASSVTPALTSVPTQASKKQRTS